MNVRRHLLAQAGLWIVASAFVGPFVVFFLYSLYLHFRYIRLGIPFAGEFGLFVQLYFLPGVIVSVATICAVTALVLAWPQLSRWAMIIPATALAAWGAMWLVWVNSSYLSEGQSHELLAITLTALLAPRLAVPHLRPAWPFIRDHAVDSR